MIRQIPFLLIYYLTKAFILSLFLIIFPNIRMANKRLGQKKDQKICIIGAGFVGQATGKGFLSKGLDVTFLDVDSSKVNKLKEEDLDAYLLEELSNGKFSFDISFITVPTPTVQGKFNNEYLKAASEYLGEKIKYLNKYHLAVVKSTVLPGTTENLVIRTLEEVSGKKAGIDFGVCANPEYLREQRAFDDFVHAWLVVIGALDEKSAKILLDIYRDFDCPKYVVSIKEAEIQKYAHNLFNAVKITFFNEIRSAARKLGIETEKVFRLVAESSEGMWNTIYGTHDMGPFDGNCLPKDTQAFLTWLKEQGIDAELLQAAIEVNSKIKKEYRETSQEIEEKKEYGVRYSS